MKIIKGIAGIARSIKSAYKRFPLPLILAALSGVLLIILNEIGYNENAPGENISRLIMVFMLGVPITLSIKLIWERRGEAKPALRLSAYGLSALFLTMYYFLLLRELEMVSIVRYAAISFMFYLIAACITCWFGRKNYEMYIIRIFSRFLITGIFALVMFLGVAGILASIDGLLEINVPSKAYLYTFYVIGTFFVPSYAFAGIPLSCSELDEAKYPKSLCVLLLYIMVPIISAYTAILYLYFVKVLVERTWPQGMVGNLVLWYSLVSIVVIFFMTPVIQEKKWVKGFVFWFTKLILPCIIILFISMGIRIKAYGVTESRYFVVLAGLWALGIFIYWNVRGTNHNIILPVSLAVVLLISTAGPFSAFEVSIRSQSSRLESIAESYGMLQEGKLKPVDGTISDKDRSTIKSILQYFKNNHSLSDIEYLPEGFKMEDTNQYFGFNIYDSYDNDSSIISFYYNSKNGNVTDIRGFDYLVSLSGGKNDGQEERFGDSYTAGYSSNNKSVVIYNGKTQIYSFNVGSFAEELNKEYNEKDYNIPQDRMTIEEDNEDLSVRIVISDLIGEIYNSSNNLEINNMTCQVYVRIK